MEVAEKTLSVSEKHIQHLGVVQEQGKTRDKVRRSCLLGDLRNALI
jgi:hypothetical protein